MQELDSAKTSQIPKPGKPSSLVIVGLIIGLVVVVGLSFLVSGTTAGGDTPSIGAIPVVRSIALPPGGDTAALPASPVIGKLAPDFTWTGPDGNAVRLSDYRGKSVLINFWATWCPPCKAEMPEIEAYWKENKDKGIVILAVNVGDESESTIRGFMQSNKLTFQALNDTAGQIGSSYRVGGIPASYFIDPQGIVRDTYVGGMTKGIIQAKVAKAR